MKLLLLCLGLIVLIRAYSEADLTAWEEFKDQFDKHYDAEDEPKRMAQFLKTKKTVDEHNKLYKEGKVSFEQGLNHFADWYPDELQKLFGLEDPDHLRRFGGPNGIPWQDPGNVRIPAFVDWRQRGAVTRVRFQGNCSVCWSFSALGALEAQHFLKYGRLLEFSEQNLVDCIQNSECHGNWMDVAFEYIKHNGVVTEAEYPYLGEKGVNGTCRGDPMKNRAIQVKGYATITRGDERLLQKAVALVGPVSIAMDVNHTSFNNHRTGIYYEPACRTDKPIHALLIVGYGTEYGQDYWLVKNSWNTWWGEQGYVKVARNRNNHCGIASWASFPIV